MAFEVKKPKQREDEGENPYEQLTASSGYQAPTSSPIMANLQADTPWRPDAGGASATGYVNFDRLYNANADVSQREARSRTDAAEKKAKGAQQGLTGAQQQFQSGLTGSAIKGPSDRDFRRASGQEGFYEKPNASAEPQGFDVSTLRPGGPSIRQSVNEQGTEENWRKWMESRAAQKYDGPGSLSESELYGQLATDAEAAQQAINNPLTGLNQTDNALLGAAGRPGFEKLKQKYGHLGDDLEAANAASVAQGKQARSESEGALAQYAALLGADDERRARGVQSAEGPASPAGSGWHPEGYTDLESFMRPSAGQGALEDVVNQAGQTINPLDQLWNLTDAGQNITQRSNGAFAGQYGTQGAPTTGIREAFGGITNKYGKAAADFLWEHMTEEMWAAYQEMNPGQAYREMEKWIESAGYSQLDGSGVQNDVGTNNPNSELQDIDMGSEPEDRQGPNGEPSRNDAAREGWLTSYDEQKRNGVQYPKRP